MLLETLFLGEQNAQTYSEGIEYSPPKDAVDSAMFNEYFNGGSYPLTGKATGEAQEDTQCIVDAEVTDRAEVASISDSQESEKKSDSGSLLTCAQTASSSNKSLNIDIQKRQLSKRAPEMSETCSWNKLQLSGSMTPSDKGSSHCQEKDMLLASLDISEASNQKLVWLAIRIIDRSSPILSEEWNNLSAQDQSVLLSYMENIYGIHLTSKKGISALEMLNALMESPAKAKRNEEKLKKTVKKINSMMTTTFVVINNLHHLTEEELEEIVFGAYFGQMAMEGSTTNIFSSNHAFSQRAFSKILGNHRYAEDFETILNSSYIPEFVKSRQEKIHKSINFIRKKLYASQEQAEHAISTDLIKRAPWSLSEVLEGVNLCQSLINRAKLI